MTYYEQRLSADKDLLRSKVIDLASKVRRGLEQSVRALEREDSTLAYQTILQDGPINRLTEEIESDCHRFIAKHLPSAGHLRFVSAVMRIAVLLERMGDYAVTISRQSVAMSEPLTGAFKRDVSSMAADALQMFDQAMQAFSQSDEALARGTMGYAQQVDRDFVNALQLLREEDPTTVGTEDLFGRLVIIRQLERVSDQAKNLCEETVFALTGETKHRKPATVLFLADTDDGTAKLAVALANERFPAKLEAESAGRRTATGLRTDVEDFLSGHGYKATPPRSIEEMERSPADFKVIVGLGTPVDAVLEDRPFGSVILQWNPEEGGDDPESIYRYLGSQIADLALLLRG